MKHLSRNGELLVFAGLALLMVATRYHHFGSALHLPDASMAIFFLGGLYLRRHLSFLALLGLAVGVDWVSVSLLGNSAFCITAAYSFLPAAYAALWYSGRAYSSRLESGIGSLAMAFGVAIVGASASFLISNGAFYWLGGRYPDPYFAEYAARAWQWGPMFVRTTLSYVAVALVAHGVFARWLQWRATVSAGA